MTVLVLQVFVSLTLVAGSLVLFASSIARRDGDHADRLSLVPLEDDAPTPSAAQPLSPPSATSR